MAASAGAVDADVGRRGPMGTDAACGLDGGESDAVSRQPVLRRRPPTDGWGEFSRAPRLDIAVDTRMPYSSKLLQYFLDHAHAGEMQSPDGVGSVGDIACGDFFEMYVRISAGRLTEINYRVFGCPAAIATCEAVAEMATGKTLAAACQITDEAVAKFLGGLPEMKLHCSNSAAEALQRAIADYLSRQGRLEPKRPLADCPARDPHTGNETEQNAAR